MTFPQNLPRFNSESGKSILQSQTGMPISFTNYCVSDPIGEYWKILGLLGRGAMTEVYIAYDKLRDQIVAVKTMREDRRFVAGAAQQFYTEALVWVSIGNHPFILNVQMVTEIASQIFISMDYIAAKNGLEGAALRDWLNTYHSLDKKVILNWSIQFCTGMEYACANDILLHGDVKPDNILIDQNENVKIADFGLSVLKTKSPEYQPGGGTLEYMAPERFSEPYQGDIRSDIYSFGVILYAMQTGELPFKTDLSRAILKIIQGKREILLPILQLQQTHSFCENSENQDLLNRAKRIISVNDNEQDAYIVRNSDILWIIDERDWKANLIYKIRHKYKQTPRINVESGEKRKLFIENCQVVTRKEHPHELLSFRNID